MKKMNLLYFGVLMFAIFVAIGLSCKKEKEEETPITPAAEDAPYYKSSTETSMTSDGCADDVLTNTFAGDAESNGKKSLLTSCATVTLVPGVLSTTWPKVLTIDFGVDPCPGNDGRSRSGKIIATLSGKLNLAGTTVSFQLENYKVDTTAISGTFSLTNDGLDSLNNNKHFSWSVTSMTLVTPSTNISYTSSKKLEWDAATLPFDVTDDILTFTDGSFTFTKNGKTTSAATSSMVFLMSCMEPVQGSTILTLTDVNPITVNYGDGACDGNITISTTYTVAGHDYTYTEVIPLPY